MLSSCYYLGKYFYYDVIDRSLDQTTYFRLGLF
ncbi:hypothetical protein E2C01_080564 [Portunus trituberculatus]|uniref:Uncharacterized protein n=1 Tax=Portunus trituberculatus TaxID=210409 RepID=A0A5B7IPJ5_PORTR|nr:hypothetical protein [Portunus trituberculatus]